MERGFRSNAGSAILSAINNYSRVVERADERALGIMRLEHQLDMDLSREKRAIEAQKMQREQLDMAKETHENNKERFQWNKDDRKEKIAARENFEKEQGAQFDELASTYNEDGEFNAAKMQGYRAPESPNKLTGNIGLEENADGSVTPVVTDVKGKTHPYTVEPNKPESKDNPRMFVAKEDVEPFSAVIDKVVVDVTKRFPNLSPEQVANALLVPDETGRAHLVDREQFVPRLEAIAPKTSQPENVKGDEQSDVPAKRKRGGFAVSQAAHEATQEVASYFTEDGKGGAVKLATDKASSVGGSMVDGLETVNNFLMDAMPVGKGVNAVKQALFGKPAIAKDIEVKAEKGADGKKSVMVYLKDMKKVDDKDVADGLEKARQANMQNGVDQQAISKGLLEMPKIKGNAPLAKAYLKMFLLGADGFTLNGARNIAETGNANYNREQLVQLGVKTRTEAAKLNKYNREAELARAKTLNELKDDPEKEAKARRAEFDHMQKVFGSVASDSADGLQLEGEAHAAFVADVKQGLNMTFELLRIDPSESSTYKNAYTLRAATDIYGHMDSDNRSMTGAYIAALNGYGHASEHFDEFNEATMRVAEALGSDQLALIKLKQSYPVMADLSDQEKIDYLNELTATVTERANKNK